MEKMNKIIRETEIRKAVADTSISINQREKIFHKYLGEEFDDNPIRKKMIEAIDEICSVHGGNLIEHMELDFR